MNYFNEKPQEEASKKCMVIFGGTGFIGSFFAKHILASTNIDTIYLLDLEAFNAKSSEYRRTMFTGESRVIFVKADVRHSLDFFSPSEDVVLIANFAAVHREPGHDDSEYFETNILGAENVCQFGERVQCNSIIFTSSISPYGISESVKDERTLPIPATAYGCSKLVAEKIHKIWQAKDFNNRRLVIVRPGVVFGPGEGGNVSRLIKATLGYYFFYMGNKSTRKAGVYIKELCNAIWVVFTQQEINGERVSLFNMSMNPGPSIKEYVDTICSVAGVKRFIPNIPYKFLLCLSHVLDFIAKPIGIRHPFSPIRIKKLVHSNDILPTYLMEHRYKYEYTLEKAFIDWIKESPTEWQ
jgi:GlcNAc-P-P-Und epimerase